MVGGRQERVKRNKAEYVWLWSIAAALFIAFVMMAWLDYGVNLLDTASPNPLFLRLAASWQIIGNLFFINLVLLSGWCVYGLVRVHRSAQRDWRHVVAMLGLSLLPLAGLLIWLFSPAD